MLIFDTEEEALEAIRQLDSFIAIPNGEILRINYEAVHLSKDDFANKYLPQVDKYVIKTKKAKLSNWTTNFFNRNKTITFETKEKAFDYLENVDDLVEAYTQNGEFLHTEYNVVAGDKYGFPNKRILKVQNLKPSWFSVHG